MCHCGDAADGGFASCCAGSMGTGWQRNSYFPGGGSASPAPTPLRCQVGHAPALNLSPLWPSLWPRESLIPQMAGGCMN